MATQTKILLFLYKKQDMTSSFEIATTFIQEAHIWIDTFLSQIQLWQKKMILQEMFQLHFSVLIKWVEKYFQNSEKYVIANVQEKNMSVCVLWFSYLILVLNLWF